MEIAQLWPLLAALLVAGIAVASSIHAIQTKREVSAAVAWVGLIWLSPIVGPGLYWLIGVNRIRRRAMERRVDGESPVPTLADPVTRAGLAARLEPDGLHLQGIARLVDRVTHRPLLPGNEVVPLDGGDEAYPAMLEAIDRAERSVSLASYIFDNDRAGSRFAYALAIAVRRGVEVRVLVDAVGARYSFPPMNRVLQRTGVPVARFMPAAFHWRMPYFNLRNHRKILVVDGGIGFTGGMNIREAFWPSLTGEKSGADLHFRVEGPVVAELQEAFVHDWYFTTGERLEGNRWFPPLGAHGDTLARGISDGPDIDYEKLHATILGALGAAEREVFVVTPYFIPDVRMSSALRLAALRGVDVNIVLPEKLNLRLVQWASTAHWSHLLEAGCRIHLTPPPFDHSKLMVVDGYWGLVGSANLDPRSLQLNFEFGLETYDAGFASRLRYMARERISIGREVSLAELRARSSAAKLRNGVARLLSPYL